MLRRTPEMVELAIDDYVVGVDAAGDVVACGALKEYSPSVAEVAAIAVSRDVHGQGVGRAIVAAVEALAIKRGIVRRLRAHAAAGVLRGDRLSARRPRAISGEDSARLSRVRAPVRVQRDLLREESAGRARRQRRQRRRVTARARAPDIGSVTSNPGRCRSRAGQCSHESSEPPVGLNGLHHAFDEARFGDQRTLNLRDRCRPSTPPTTRADAWLRQQQVDAPSEVLIITGRGNNSEGGVSPSFARPSIACCTRCAGAAWSTAHEEHTPGSFVVTLAPVSALWESPQAQSRTRRRPPPPPTPPSLDDARRRHATMLRNLAERALEGWASRTPRLSFRERCSSSSARSRRRSATRPAATNAFARAIRAALDQYE